MRAAIDEVFPWVRHLSESERSCFVDELVTALSGEAEPAIDGTAREVIAGWSATARIKADQSQHESALASTEGDFGPVAAIA